MIPPVLVTAPAEMPVSVAEAKAHLRVGFSTDDTLIGSLIAAATAHLDGWSGILGRCIVTQTWSQSYPCWPADGVLRLPFPNVDAASVTLTYLDTLGDVQTVADALYEVIEDARGAYVRLRDAFTAPSLENDRAKPVTATFDAGYGDAAATPAALKAAILLMLADLYENREGQMVGVGLDVRPNPTVDRLIAPYRRVGL